MPLPTPSAAAVASYHDLYQEKFGVDLSPEDSLEAATHTLQIFFLKHYPIRPPRKKPEGKRPGE